MRKTIWSGLSLCLLTVAGCVTEDKGKPCTASVELSFCLTYNGGDTLLEELLYIRESSAKVPPTAPVSRDTLHWVWDPCFAEAQGPQRILVLSHDSVVFQSDWITVGSKDGCHADPTTVDIRRE